MSNPLNNLTKSTLERFAKNTTKNTNIQQALLKMSELPAPDYRPIFRKVMSKFGLAYANEVSDLDRENIIGNIGTDTEECIVGDAQELVYLDKHPAKMFVCSPTNAGVDAAIEPSTVRGIAKAMLKQLNSHKF